MESAVLIYFFLSEKCMCFFMFSSFHAVKFIVIFQIHYRVCKLPVILQICGVTYLRCCFRCFFYLQGEIYYFVSSIFLTSTHWTFMLIVPFEWQDLLTKHLTVVSEYLTAHYDEVCTQFLCDSILDRSTYGWSVASELDWDRMCFHLLIFLA